MTNKDRNSRIEINNVYDLINLMLIICIMFGTAIPSIIYDSVILVFIMLSFYRVITRNKILNNYYVLWWLLLCCFVAFNSFYSVIPENTYNFLVAALTRFVIIASFTQHLKDLIDIERKMSYFKIIGLCVVAFALIIERGSFLQLGLGYSVGGKIIFSYTIIPVTILYIYDLIKMPKVSTLIFTLFMYLGCIFSAGRKSAIIPLVYLFILMFIRNNNSILKLIKGLAVFVFIIFVFFYLSYNVPIIYNLFGVRLDGLLNSIVNSSEIDKSTQIRKNMINFGFNIFKERPIFGYGMDTFKTISPFNVYSHNNYVETLVSGGIALFILYYSIHVALIFKLYTLVKLKLPYADFFLALVVTFLLFDLGTISYFIYQINFLLCMASSLCMRNKTHDKRKGS